jgi:hypothetical protein
MRKGRLQSLVRLIISQDELNCDNEPLMKFHIAEGRPFLKRCDVRHKERPTGRYAFVSAE